MGLRFFKTGAFGGNLLEFGDTKHSFIPTSSPPLSIVSFFSPSLDVTQNISRRGRADSFCSDSSAVEAHLAERVSYLLYTSICYTGLIKCVLMQEYAHTHTRTQTPNVEGAQLLSITVPVTLESEVSLRRGGGACVCLQQQRVAGDCFIVLQISCQSTYSWPVGDIRGLSGRCE